MPRTKRFKKASVTSSQELSLPKLLFKSLQIHHHLWKLDFIDFHKSGTWIDFIDPAFCHPESLAQLQAISPHCLKDELVRVLKCSLQYVYDLILKSTLETSFTDATEIALNWANKHYISLDNVIRDSFLAWVKAIQGPNVVSEPTPPTGAKPTQHASTCTSPESLEVIYVKGAHSVLSNFYRGSKPILYNGIPYPTLEHAYQSEKCWFYSDHPTYSFIFQCETASEVKAATKHLNCIQNPKWNEVKVPLMKHLLFLKFQSVPEFASFLLSTRGSILKHPVPDRFWGTGPNFDGQDMFSQLLMELRNSVL